MRRETKRLDLCRPGRLRFAAPAAGPGGEDLSGADAPQCAHMTATSDRLMNTGPDPTTPGLPAANRGSSIRTSDMRVLLVEASGEAASLAAQGAFRG
jgi:hypothetical protein